MPFCLILIVNNVKGHYCHNAACMNTIVVMYFCPPATVTPAVLFPNGDYASVVVGSPLTIPVYIITSGTLNQSSVEFRPVTGIPVATPTIIFSSDGVKVDIVYDKVVVPSTTAHEICFDIISDEGSSSGMLEPALTKTCIGLFTLSVTGTHISQ